MNDNLLISAVQAAFDEAVQKAVATHITQLQQQHANVVGELAARVAALETKLPSQAELVAAIDWSQVLVTAIDWSQVLDYEEIAKEVDLKQLTSEIDLSDLASEIDLSDLASEIDADKLMEKYDLDEALRDWFSEQSFSITP